MHILTHVDYGGQPSVLKDKHLQRTYLHTLTMEVRQVYSKTSYLLAHAYTHADYQVRFAWWLKVDNTDI